MNNETGNKYNSLIEQVNNIQRRTGLTWTEIGRQSGINKTVVSLFMKGKYTGDNDKIADALSRWVEANQARTTMRQKMRAAPDFVFLPSCQRWWQVFEYAQMAQDIGVITGAPGTSKTATAQHYCQNSSNAWLVTADSSIRTPRAILREVAEVVGCPAVRGPRMMREVINRLKDTGGLLIIDEAQHLTTPALDLLRSLNDRAGIGIAWIGNEPLRGRIEGMGREASFAQIFSRVGMWKSRHNPTKADLNQLIDAWGVESAEVRKTLQWIGSREGGLRELNKTLRFAWFLAGSQGRDELTEADVEAGWNQRRPTALLKKMEA